MCICVDYFLFFFFFFFKQKTAYEMRISDWSSDVCSSDLLELVRGRIVLPELYLDRPVIRLERRDDGTPNWAMGASRGSAAVEATVPEERTEFPVIGRLWIEEGVRGYEAPADDVSIVKKVSTATEIGRAHV